MTPEQLKASILQYAIQGKLVEQRPEEGTAEELYRQIQEEKQRLVKEGKIKKEKPLPEIAADEVPFEIPEGWKWVYIGDIFLHNTGKAQNSSCTTNGIIRKFITTSNLYWNSFDFSKVKEMSFTEQELKRCTVKKGDLLVCEGGDCGRSAIWSYDEEVCIQNHVHRLRPYKEISIKYFYYIFYLYKFTGKLRGRGVAIQGLSNEAIHKVMCPFPPLAEQKRIVAKIEELMPLVERYAASYEKLEQFNAKFPENLKKSILQYAIQGKLVEQRPEEGTAEELYQQIQEEKRRLLKEGKIKKEKPLPEIAEDEAPFEIPGSWKWVRFGSIVVNKDSERIPLSVTERSKLEKIFDYYGASGIIDKVDKYLFDKTLLLIGEDGANLLARNTPIAFLAEGKYWVNNHAHVLDCVEGTLSLEYMMNFINAISLAKYITGTAQPKMNQGKMNSIPVALPPLAEQKRIVAKLEELLPLCERLEDEYDMKVFADYEAEKKAGTLKTRPIGELWKELDL